MLPLPELLGGSVLHCFCHNSVQSLSELFWGSVLNFFTRCHHDALSSFKLLHIFVRILSRHTTQAQRIAHNTLTRAFGLSSSKPFTLIGSTISPFLMMANQMTLSRNRSQKQGTIGWCQNRQGQNFMQGTQVREAVVRGQLKLDKLIKTKVMLIFPLLTSSKQGVEAKGLSSA